MGIYNLLFSAKIDTLSRLKKYTTDEGENAYIKISKVENKNKEKNLFKLCGICGGVLPKR